MAPEQARGAWDEVDGRTDIWGLGATMFTVLTGRSVHHGRTANELLIAAATQAPPSVGQFVRLPAGVAALIDRALRLDPGERWPDASTLRRELALAGREAPPAETHEDAGAAAAVRTIDDRMNVRGWSSVRQIAPAAALACAIAGVIMFEARPQQREETYRTARPIAGPVSTSSASIAQQPLALRNTQVLQPKLDLEAVSRPSPAVSARNDKPARPMPRLNPSSRQVGAPSSSSIGSTDPHPASSSTPTSLAEPASSANLLDRWQ
jgi:serine/threonine-protein kinase